MIDFNVSIDDKAKDKTIIIQSFMRELCNRDDLDNRGHPIEPGRQANIFPVEGIREAVLRAFSLDYILFFLRECLQENSGNEPFEFLDNDINVRLLNPGRARCGEYGL